MTPEQQRIAIAKACGTLRWTWLDKHYPDCPHYPDDLNAMHEAVAVLTPDQYRRFHAILCDMTHNEWMASEECHARHVNEATAAQRAEAFLRTIGE